MQKLIQGLEIYYKPYSTYLIFFVIKGDKVIVIRGYTVLVTAEGYTAKTLTFEILEADGNPVENEKSAPDVIATKYVKAGIWDPAYYRVTFDVTDEKATKEYLNADKTITVNGISYKKTSIFSTSRSNEYKVSKDEVYGVVKYLDFTADGFTEEENEVVIEADGYGTLTFIVELTASEADMKAKEASAFVKAEEAAGTEDGRIEEASETEDGKTKEAAETEETEDSKTEEAEKETAEPVDNKTEDTKEETLKSEEENEKEAADNKIEEIQEETAETGKKDFDSQEKQPEEETEIGKTTGVVVGE